MPSRRSDVRDSASWLASAVADLLPGQRAHGGRRRLAGGVKGDQFGQRPELRPRLAAIDRRTATGGVEAEIIHRATSNQQLHPRSIGARLRQHGSISVPDVR
jgi:hypothetical protein